MNRNLQLMRQSKIMVFTACDKHNRVAVKLFVNSFFLLCPFFLLGQSMGKDSLLQEVTLKSAVDYAIVHQPQIQQSIIDQQILETTIRSKLADWYPQINFNYNLQHNFIVQTAIIGGNAIKLGVNNTSAGQFTVSQAIFNKDVLLASRTKTDARLQARQLTSNNKIELAADVSKAFYDVLSTEQQIKVSTTNIQRIEQSLKDAFNQYKAGIADKIDYKRATITLNNSKAAKRSNEELLKAKLENLKTLMGYPLSASLNIVYDSLQMEKEIALDTSQEANYTARIEYQLLETQRRLLQYNVQYNKWSYLPTISANGAYNLSYQNNNFAKIYSNNFPNSFAALTLGFPIFQGGKRKAALQAAQLELERNSLDIINLKNSVNSAYTQAMAVYKSNLENFQALKQNLVLAKEVYDVLQLQYKSGIKAYLEVITSETDLRTAEINYYASLYQLMASKIDVQKALGQIVY
ncbi:MAG: outer rane efflux protein [Ferruginibacter sp.]|uniref:TolC family protein n=1 Tax=Ferruginibacter sp. TaxID=1940288 RepID=UPI00265A7A46|nr:TolC family protein [Ferruginibacter sp.]MDB5277169.1 outer rane efflux protein [Ferruginibacter sp.]